MDKESLLTVIIFTYNHKNTIAKCIESIVNQKTDYKYEIHICDDASFDGTADICREYGEKYPDKIKLFLQEKNTLSVSLKDNHALSAYKRLNTKYWCYIDGDDYWCDENKVRIALDFLEKNPEYIGFAHDTLQVDEFLVKEYSYIHDILNWKVNNKVVFESSAPFLLPSSRIFKNQGFDWHDTMIGIDYLFYYYNLSKGPIYYYDKIMAVHLVGYNGLFSSLGDEAKEINSMFAFHLSLLFEFEKDEFCTDMQKCYDSKNGIDEKRYKRLCLLKKIFGIRIGWYIWFIAHFVFRYGFKSMGINYVFPSMKKEKLLKKIENKQKKLLIKNKILFKLQKYLFKNLMFNSKIQDKMQKSISRKEERITKMKEEIFKINQERERCKKKSL